MRNFILLSSLFLMSCSPAVFYNNLGRWDLVFKNKDEAGKKFHKSLARNPSLIVGRYNLALNEASQEKIHNALTELDQLEDQILAKKAQPWEVPYLFEIFFAKAYLYGLINKIPEALDYYQKALDLKPKSKTVKENIELLLKSSQSTNSKSGKKGDQGGKGKGKSDQNQKGDKSKDQEGKDKKDKEDMKGQDDDSLKKKNLSEEEVEQILKEIKKQESQVRAKENTKNNKKGGASNEKTW